MALSVGTRFGTFEILSLLGQGGMGEVYRARDARLNREVALKVLPEAFTSDPDRLARFTREAQILAALSHSNIAAIHGLEEAQGHQALVLELVEGPTLAERIAQGALPLDEALPIARQVAEALEAAHEQGIIHRDLKPANIKLRPDGTVKVLDFGLAKALSREDSAATANRPDVTASPTLMSPATMTSAGMILGTAAYMSPEQARGKTVDRRADIWAFGCVLFEMLTGRRAFAGDEVTDTLAGILRGEPEWERLPPSVPPPVRRLVRRCLEKNPRERLQAIGDARLEIAEALNPGRDDEKGAAPVPQRSLNTPGVLIATAAVTALIVGVAAWTLKPAGPAEARRVIRALIAVNPFDQRPPAGPGQTRVPVGRPDRTAIALSPDGRTLVFRGIAENVVPGGGSQSVLFVRPLDSLIATPIVTTTAADSPFFSPDGAWIAYVDAGELRRVPATGGTAAHTRIAQIPNGRQRIAGAHWGEGDVIVFATVEGLWRVPGSGGTPEQIAAVRLDDENARLHPHLLPGGEWVLFTVQKTTFRWDDAQVVARSLATSEEKVLLNDAADARYVPGGHLVFLRRGKLMAVPFDPERVTLTGAAVAVVDDVMQAVNMGNSAADSGAGQFTIAAQGTLVYVTGGLQPILANELVWVDRTGSVQPVGAPHGPFRSPRLSPNGQHILMFSGATANEDGNRVWVYDLARRTHVRVTGPTEHVLWGVWSPDGSRVVFESLTAGRGTLYTRSADGSGVAEELTEVKPTAQAPSSWSRTNKLAFVETDPKTGHDIRVLDVTAGDRSGSIVVQTPAQDSHPAFSPDGKWLAYSSSESGRTEVYIQPYPGPGQRVLISTGGGDAPAWRGDGEELYYQFLNDGALRILAVPITITTTGLSPGTPRQLFEGRGLGNTFPARGYDVTPDGMRFLFTRSVEAPPRPPSQLVLVENWIEELKRLDNPKSP